MAGLYSLNILLVSTLFALPTLAQPPADPLNFCRRYGHQTAVIDRRLYIDGGWLYASPIQLNPIPTMNQGLLYDDLNRVYDGMPKQFANLTKNSSVPDVAGGVLWPDEVNKVFWLYGGEFSQAPSSFELWGYDVILNQWNLSTASTISTAPIQRVSYGAGVASSTIGQGFYYGGYLNNLTNPLWTGPQIATSNLLIFDMDGNSLSNNSGYDDTGRAEGTMVYIPASGAGLLIYFGGVTFPYGNETEVAATLDTILIYDTGDANWHVQTATGQIPETRRKFCGGATWAKDQSSYNVYIYGGFGFGENATGFDDVYILTMPAFEWIKWYPDKPGPGSPHGLLTCNVIDNSQMLVMGGNFTNTTKCDVPAIQGQHNLNLGQLDATDAKWYSYLPNVTEYFVPPAILKITGGTAEGGATQKAPILGWDDNRVSVYFGEQASVASRTPTRIIPTPTASLPPPPPPPKPSKETTNIGAVVGGTVGGVVLLIVAISGLLFCLRRKRNRQTQASSAHPDITSMPSPIQGYLSDPKYSMSPRSPPSTARSPNLSAHRQEDSITHSSPYATPPPVQPEYSYHHPAHGQRPIPYYPPPLGASDASRAGAVAQTRSHEMPAANSLASHEMPTVRSPEGINIAQPRPVRKEVGSSSVSNVS